jgi:hypothetical protein
MSRSLSGHRRYSVVLEVDVAAMEKDSKSCRHVPL